MAKKFDPSNFGTKLTLLFCSCDSNALGAVTTPILAVMALAFPGENVNMLVALPPLFIIPTSLIVGRLAYYISRKTLLTIGQILYIIGGVGAALCTDFSQILAMRVILGIGCGIVYPIIPTLIAQFYSGHERAQMLGRANAVGGIIAMTMSLAAGILATIGWHLPFYLDLFFVVVLIMQLIFLPKVPPEKKMGQIAGAQEVSFTKEEKRLGLKPWLCILLMFASMTVGMVYLLNMAGFIVERNIGDSSFAGIASSATTGAAFLLAFTFPFILKRLKRYTVLIPMLTASLAFILLYLADNTVMVLLGAITFGCYLGYLIPFLQTTVSALVHPARRTFTLAILSSAMFAGQACSTPYVSLIQGFVGTDISQQFFVMSLCFIGLFAITGIYLLGSQKSWKPYPYADIAEFESRSQQK